MGKPAVTTRTAALLAAASLAVAALSALLLDAPMGEQPVGAAESLAALGLSAGVLEPLETLETRPAGPHRAAFAAIHAGRRVNIEVVRNLSPSAAERWFAAQTVAVSRLHEPALPPYPEFKAPQRPCPDRFRPRARAHALGTFFLAFANAEYGLGVCEEGRAAMKVAIGLFRLPERAAAVRIELFAPKDESDDALERAMLSIRATGKNASEPPRLDAEPAATIEVFTVSACPFTRSLVRALASFLEDADEKTRRSVRVSFAFYGKEEAPGRFDSFHGREEAGLNVLELCLIDKYPDLLEQVRIIDCLNHKVDLRDAAGSIPRLRDGWKECTAGVAHDRDHEVGRCAAGEEGARLYRESIRRALGDPEARFPPTLKLNGRPFPATNPWAFRLELCRLFGGCEGKLRECYNDVNCAPVEGKTALCLEDRCVYEPKLRAIVLEEGNGAEDGAGAVSPSALQWYRQIVGDFDVERVDAASERGRALAGAAGLDRFPALLFPETIAKTSAFREGLGPIWYVFSKKRGGHFVVDHERFDLGRKVVDRELANPYGVHLNLTELEVSSELRPARAAAIENRKRLLRENEGDFRSPTTRLLTPDP